MRSPSSTLASTLACGTPIASATPAKLKASPAHCERAQPLAEKLIGAERDEERRGVEKHHRARRRGQQQAAIDQHEFDAEQHAGEQSGAQRAVALEQFDAAHHAAIRISTGSAPEERIAPAASAESPAAPA